MPEVNIYNLQGEVVGQIELAEHLFAIEPNEDVLFRAVTRIENNKRQGTHKVKSRGEVSGGGRKPWRQKGTGRARHGSIRSPLWVGGGVAFGPTPRSYRTKLNKKQRRLALASALSNKLANSKVVVVDDFNLAEPKTKLIVEALKNLKIEDPALLISEESNRELYLASRNVPELKATHAGSLDVYDILRYDYFVISRAAVEKIQEVYAQ